MERTRTPSSSGLIVLYIPVGDVSASAIGSSLRYIVRGLHGSGISRWPTDAIIRSLPASVWQGFSQELDGITQNNGGKTSTYKDNTFYFI